MAHILYVTAQVLSFLLDRLGPLVLALILLRVMFLHMRGVRRRLDKFEEDLRQQAGWMLDASRHLVEDAKRLDALERK